MNFHVLTLFPDMIRNGFQTSITGRAAEKGLLSLETVNIRDFSVNKHNRVDDYPYGGGAGMVMQAEPVCLAYESVAARLPGKHRVLYMSPQGKVFDQEMAKELAKEEELIFLCGHYEGIDERVLEEIVTDEVSIGDYVLTGGELPALVIMDAVSRLLEGVLHNEESAQFDSFHDNLLEYPQYSRPEEWRGKKVPPILLSGHHANVERWRREQSLLRTKARRPDLLERAALTREDKKFLAKSEKL
ncbi:MAG: tRNA (guanosine(37)-N1)-methyltransferase TrmD [Lachnospiraceae bacterium]|nr:tRNA (guanosine(37)-N1)-methyltransferase TrmD [Lachnospiraceae bacterium]